MDHMLPDVGNLAPGQFENTTHKWKTSQFDNTTTEELLDMEQEGGM